MLSPAFFSVVDVLVTEGAPACSCKWFGRIALFSFGVSPVVSLVNGFLTSRTAFVVLAVIAFRQEVAC